MVISHSYVQQNQRVLAQAKCGHASKYGYLSFCWILKLTQHGGSELVARIRRFPVSKSRGNKNAAKHQLPSGYD